MFLVKLQVRGNPEEKGFLGTFQKCREDIKKKFEQLPLDLTKVTPMWKLIEIQIF